MANRRFLHNFPVLLVATLLTANLPAIASPSISVPIIEAAAHGQADRVKSLLDAGADINARDGQGKTALIWSVELGRQDIAQMLMARHADVNIRDNAGETALSVAVKTLQARRNAPPPAVTATPMRVATPKKPSTTASSAGRIAGKAAASIFGPRVGTIVNNTTSTVVQQGSRMAQSARKKATGLSNSASAALAAPPVQNAIHDARRMISSVISPTPTQQTSPQVTPAQGSRRGTLAPHPASQTTASAVSSDPIAALLHGPMAATAKSVLQQFAGGGQMDASSTAHWTALLTSAVQSDPSILGRLVSAATGGRLARRDIVEVIGAAVQSDAGLARLFCRQFQGVAADDHANAIVQAALSNNADLLLTLLTTSDADIFSSVSVHALDWALKAVAPGAPLEVLIGPSSQTIAQGISLVKSLLASGANVDAQDNLGMTALMWAAKAGLGDVANLLLSTGANRLLTDVNGQTALQQAISAGVDSVVDLLKNAVPN